MMNMTINFHNTLERSVVYTFLYKILIQEVFGSIVDKTYLQHSQNRTLFKNRSISMIFIEISASV